MTNSERTAEVERRTGETDVRLSMSLDGAGTAEVDTGVGFLDHMLVLFAKHSLFDLQVEAGGDTEVDDHHTVEDIGITLGQAFDTALGDKAGIGRFACKTLPMDEALVRCSVDISGRPFVEVHAEFQTEKVGSFDVELSREFIRAFATNARLTLHVDMLRGDNSHHIIEAIFKTLARTLREAVSIDPRDEDVPSTKGVL